MGCNYIGSTVKLCLRELVHLKVDTEWYSLGLELGLPEHTLNIIENDSGNDCKTCMRKMFSKWLTTNKAANWKDIIKGLVAINKKDIAENVSQQYSKLNSSCVVIYTIHNRHSIW